MSLQQNLCKPSFTVIMTDIQKLTFSVSYAGSFRILYKAKYNAKNPLFQ
jgi:hypothetical protein